MSAISRTLHQIEVKLKSSIIYFRWGNLSGNIISKVLDHDTQVLSIFKKATKIRNDLFKLGYSKTKHILSHLNSADWNALYVLEKYANFLF